MLAEGARKLLQGARGGFFAIAKVPCRSLCEADRWVSIGDAISLTARSEIYGVCREEAAA